MAIRARIESASRLVAADTRPTLALFDFDPKGLAMAASLPRREALCLPEWEVLEPLVTQRNRYDLFGNQVAGCRVELEACTDQEIALAWSRMRLLNRGLNQEAFPETD